MFLSSVFAVIILPATVLFLFGFGNEEFVTDDIGISVLLNGRIQKFNLEDYLFGVVAAEMPAAFHEEALKAQAVAARTYIINKKIAGNSDHSDADVCTDSIHCKAYLTENEIVSKYGEGWMTDYSAKIKKAIRDTAGEIAVYEEQPIEAVFHSTGSGITENAKDVWGGEVPYLVSVESPGDAESPVYLSDVPVSFKEIKEKVFDKTNKDISVYAGEITRNESGSVKSIDIGGVQFGGVEVREMFSLPSANFEVSLSGENLVFHCKGKGHGVGMSQYGAQYFAKQGMNYKDILKTYYKGIEIGEINDKDFKSKSK